MADLDGVQQFSVEAAHAADIMAILNDVAQSQEASKLYLSGSFDGDGENMRIRRSLYESSLISFRRAFKNGSSRIPGPSGRATWRFPEDLIGDYQEDYNELIRLGDKTVAHRASPEAGQAEFVKNEPAGQPFLQIKYSERADMLARLLVITERIKQILLRELSEKIADAKSASAN